MTRAGFPPEIAADEARAKRLEYWTLGWMASVTALMFLAAGSSQAMKSAWVEDLMSMVPAVIFLIAARQEVRRPSAAFPFGFHRVQSLASLIAAVVLSAVGAFLLFEAVMTLVRQERAEIGTATLLGTQIWMGWVMIAALCYSVVPPLILGRMKLPIARRMHDEVLHTDAMTQKADWMTGLAGVAGVGGIGLGLWWADAVAAGLISFSILHDGVGALRRATAELVDGAPRDLDNGKIAPDAQQLKRALKERYPDAEIRLRETGRFINAQVHGVAPDGEVDLGQLWPGDPERRWRFAQLSFVPPEKGEE